MTEPGSYVDPGYHFAMRDTGSDGVTRLYTVTVIGIYPTSADLPPEASAITRATVATIEERLADKSVAPIYREVVFHLGEMIPGDTL